MTVGPLLPHEVTPEDIALGYLWGSRFRNAHDEVAKGGTIYGTPTINHGLPLNGTTDYINYFLNNQLAVSPLSSNFVFNPNFEADDDIRHRIIDGVGTRPILEKREGGGAANALYMYAGNATVILTSALAVYQQYWRVDSNNLLTVIADATGNNKAYLNGNQIASSSTVWTVQSISSSLLIGQASGFWFSGRMELLKFYNRLITEQEHINLWRSVG